MRKWSIQYRVLIKVAIVVHEEGNTLCNKQEPKVLLIYRQAKLQCSLILECYTCIYHACVYYDATRQSQTCHTLVTHKIIASHYTPQASPVLSADEKLPAICHRALSVSELPGIEGGEWRSSSSKVGSKINMQVIVHAEERMI